MKLIKIISLFSLIILFSCSNEIDNITNLNDPDRNQVLANGSDLIGVLTGGFADWWQANNLDVVPSLSVAADVATCSWGNKGMRVLSNEPRNPILNTGGWSDISVIEQPWQGNYGAIASANDIIKAINSGISWVEGGEDRTPIVLAGSHFLRGLSYGYLGLLFEKGFIVDENTDLSSDLPFVSYGELIDFAVKELDKTISIATSTSIELPSTLINGVSISSDKLIRLCNSYKARFIVQSARNEIETNAVDWSQVKNFAENGIVEDFGPNGDNGITWWSWRFVFSDSPNGFGAFGARLDMRLINLLDPTQPEFFPATSGSTLQNPEITTADARVGEGKDFEFRPDILFRSERGRFHYSHYIHVRYKTDINFSDGADSKQLKEFMVEDNRLLLAEAKLRLNDFAGAIADVNASSRVTRGSLEMLASSASSQEIMDAIFYERYIELFGTATGGGFFDRRRTNDLQVGTFRHFPVPSSELEVLSQELYTLGGSVVDPTGLVPHYNLGAAPARTDDTSLPTFN